MLAAKITRKVVKCNLSSYEESCMRFFFYFTEYSSVVMVTYTMYGMLRVRGASQRWGFHEFFHFHQRNAKALP